MYVIYVTDVPSWKLGGQMHSCWMQGVPRSHSALTKIFRYSANSAKRSYDFPQVQNLEDEICNWDGMIQPSTPNPLGIMGHCFFMVILRQRTPSAPMYFMVMLYSVSTLVTPLVNGRQYI